jgi:hypothetical protein
MGFAKLDYVGPSASGGDSSTVESRWWVDNCSDYSDAVNSLLSAAPVRLGQMVITGYRVDPETDTLYLGSVTYGTKQLDESTYSFEIGTSPTKITQSLQTVGSYARPGNTPSNFGGAIGVTKEGVEGTDISVPTFSWTETHYLVKQRVNKAFFFVLFNLTGQMNAGTFRDFDRGEVLLIGVNGSASRLVPKFELQFKFLALPNSPGGSINDIPIGPKLGHDYLWVRYRDRKDAASNSMVKIPYEVFIERVYQFGDYDQLSLPEPF